MANGNWRLTYLKFAARPVYVKQFHSMSGLICFMLHNYACKHMHTLNIRIIDIVSEWLRRWTQNPLGSARRGSNPLGVAVL